VLVGAPASRPDGDERGGKIALAIDPEARPEFVADVAHSIRAISGVAA
jgi:hypothetical protein